MRVLPVVLAATLTVLAGCGALPDGRVAAGLSPKGEPIAGQQYARSEPAPRRPPVAQFAPDDAVAHAFAVGFLNSIQPRSIGNRIEYCGYFYMTQDGAIAATPPRPGTFASCNMPGPEPGLGIFASYHTHSAFAPSYDNEVPSVTDLLSDFEFAIDGYVSTPGGRVWHVDYGTRSTSQICGPGCVYQDPGFRPLGEAAIRASYTLPQLGQRAGEF